MRSAHAYEISVAPEKTTRASEREKSKFRGLRRFVKSLVVKRAAHWRELFAETLGVRCRDVALIRALTLPDFDNREMVRATALLKHVKTKPARLFAAGIS